MRDTVSDPIEVYRARGLADAHALRLLLDAEGIPAWVDNELLQGAAGGLPLGWVTGPRVMVAREHEAVARAVVGRFTADRTTAGPDGDGFCLACRSPMGPANTCPACGWSYLGEPAEAEPTPGSAAPPVVGNGESSPAPVTPPAGLTRRELWGEVAAVAAVGVVPYLIATVTLIYSPAPPLPYWLDALQLVILSGCTIFVTLYLIHRSGEGWAHFGITRPSLGDAAGGFVLLFVGVVLWRLALDLPAVGNPPASLFSRPEGVNDRWLAAKYAVSAFAEELVCRAYLITRLAALLRSRGQAVLLAAVGFAAYHAYQGLQGVALSFVFGVAYGLAFLVVRRVWPLAIGHALYDIRADLLAG